MTVATALVLLLARSRTGLFFGLCLLLLRHDGVTCLVQHPVGGKRLQKLGDPSQPLTPLSSRGKGLLLLVITALTTRPIP